MVDMTPPPGSTRTQEPTARPPARRRYRRLFDLAPEAYVVTDHEGVIIEANQAAETLLGSWTPARPLEGRSLTALLRLRDHREARPGWSLPQGPPGPRRWECLLSSTPPRAVLVTLAVEGDDLLWILSEKPGGRSSTGPVMEPEPAREGDRQAHQRLERERDEREELVALVSHELRNSLHAVLSWSQTMVDSPRLDECHQALRVVERSGRMMAMLVDDLLERSSMLRAPRPLRRQRLDLSLLLEQVLLLVEPLRRVSTRTFSLERPPGPVWFLGDEHRLTQVFLNLLANAIKYSISGGLIAVRLHADRSWAEVRVRDSGQGIAAEHLSQIFQPLYQGDAPAVSSSHGLGLGLTVARHLVTAHGGTVEAESEGPGMGTTFVVRLPLASPFGT